MNKMEKYCVFDIEGKNWNEFILGGWYDGKTYEEFESMEDLMSFMFSHLNATDVAYAHFGGIYDFLFVFDFLFDRSTEVEITNIIMTGSKLLKFDVVWKKKKISFIDSSGLFPFSLLKLTHSFDVKHKKKEIDFDDMDNVPRETLSEYLMYDNKGLYESLEKFFAQKYVTDVVPQLTRSGISFAVFKKFFSPELPLIKNEVKAFARKAYFGGRVEIFKPVFKARSDDEKMYYQDINSLYPSVMHDYEYPGEFLCWSTTYFPDRFGIYHVQVYAPETLEFPVLGISMDGKFVFPVGYFEGHFTNVELNKALALGYRIEKIFKGALFRNAGKMFQPFVAHFYGLRKASSDPVEKIIYKDIMNHLYGRLAINEIRDQISLEPSKGSKIVTTFKIRDYEIRLYSKEKKIFTYSNPVLSCFVTSYARLRLYSFFEQCNFDVFYCDTDSIFSRTPCPFSDELGQMKLEDDTIREACFLLPKTYMYRNDLGDVVRKMKGFHANSIGHIDINDFVESVSGDIRIAASVQKGGLARFKTGLKRGDLLTVLPDSSKQLRKSYDKRIIFKKGEDYFTKPIKLELQQELFL